MTDALRPPHAPRRRGFFCLALLAVLVCGGAYAAWDIHHFLTTPASGEGREIRISIRHRATLAGVAEDLARAGAIADARRFRLLGLYRQVQGKIRAGEFIVNSGWLPDRVLEQITVGQPVLYRLFVREGLPWWETAKAVEEQGFASFADFRAVIHDPAFLREHHIPFASAEGFLFPETYLLRKPRDPLDREQARNVASLLVGMFWQKTAPAWNRLPLRQGVTITAGRRAASPYAPPLPMARNATLPAGDKGAPAAKASSLQPGGSNGTLPANDPPQAESAAALPEDAPSSQPGGAAVPSGSGGAASAPAASAVSGNSAAPRADAAPEGWKDDGPQQPSDVDPEALRRLIILASLVEKETAVPAERPRVAGVYANRLRLGMLLQCDPTIIYGLGPEFSGAIRRSQIQDAANAYNTYKHAGLPPGPVCSPGLAAILAASMPERHDFLFFVATGLGDGSHVFSRASSEHNAAVQRYRARIRGGRGN
ncbi:MAG: endolytic transglycosylase MltG [Desulfovibrio sp.]|jgi:cell division protein YceG involved in septum cleavage|nr:endolytic transglycosylase MltG [Desulfovibrio sp.]